MAAALLRLRWSVYASIGITALLTALMSWLVSVGPSSAQSVTLSEGHLDLVAVRLEAGQLQVRIRDSINPANVIFRDPRTTNLQVKAAAKTTVPSAAAFGFLGTPGASVWILPQVQNSTLLWPGWSTEELASGALTGDAITWRLTSVSGPGRFVLYTTDGFGTSTVLFN